MLKLTLTIILALASFVFFTVSATAANLTDPTPSCGGTVVTDEFCENGVPDGQTPIKNG